MADIDTLVTVRDALNIKARVDPELYGLADQVAAFIRTNGKPDTVDGFKCDKPPTTWLYLLGLQRGTEFDVAKDRPFFSRLEAEKYDPLNHPNVLAVPMDRAYVCPPLSPVDL
jgi:hypothetical protein